MNDLLDIATNAARAAGDVLRERFVAAPVGVRTKSTTTDMVSEADRAAEELIVSRIRDARPQDALLAEESGSVAGTSGIRWVVDPLDGTTNFLYRIPHWSVSIAAEDDEGVAAAAIYDPIRDEMFTGVRGSGAFLNDEQITVSSAEDLKRSLILTGFGYDPAQRSRAARFLPTVLPNVRDIRRAGSAALDMAWVACGRADAYYEAPTEWWDIAAGTLIVAEAGGTGSRLSVAGWEFGAGWLTATPGIYDDLLALVVRAIESTR